MNSSAQLPSPTSSSSPIWDSLAVFVCGLVVQFYYMSNAPLVALQDSVEYTNAALRLLNGDPLSVIPSYRTPGYSGFLAGIFWLFSGSGLAVVFVQHFLIAALASLLTLVSGYYSKRLYAIAVGLLVCFDPILAFYGNMVLSEVLFCFLLTIATATSLRMKTSPAAAAFAGIVFGFATLVRPSALIAFIATCALASLSFYIRYTPSKHVMNVLSLLMVGYLAVLIPWMAVRYNVYGTLSLTGNISGFLKVQMILEKGNFDPTLIPENDIRREFFKLVEKRREQTDEEKLYRKGFSFAFRDYLVTRMSPNELNVWYDQYLARYKRTYPRRYYLQTADAFFGLMQLNRLSDFTPRTALYFLEGGKSYDKHLKTISKKNYDTMEVLYHPKEVNSFGKKWSLTLKNLHRSKPLIAGTFFLLVVTGCFAIIRNSSLDPILLLPYFIFGLQALGYAYYLHIDDRYTFVLNPLLFFQLSLILGFDRDLTTIDLKNFRGLIGGNDDLDKH